MVVFLVVGAIAGILLGLRFKVLVLVDQSYRIGPPIRRRSSTAQRRSSTEDIAPDLSLTIAKISRLSDR